MEYGQLPAFVENEYVAGPRPEGRDTLRLGVPVVPVVRDPPGSTESLEPVKCRAGIGRLLARRRRREGQRQEYHGSNVPCLHGCLRCVRVSATRLWQLIAFVC